ncbi:hypothetical protein E2C01_091839 [Portunus trituberculatus]|uniref:Uncharacterized protein n=1 Tax=Portunus trituberculatus TaxID=210409 RepID=A0A5B7JQ60_PORTR|nr:hypothetical protein [Portunus trituberculatus]
MISVFLCRYDDHRTKCLRSILVMRFLVSPPVQQLVTALLPRVFGREHLGTRVLIASTLPLIYSDTSCFPAHDLHNTPASELAE